MSKVRKFGKRKGDRKRSARPSKEELIEAYQASGSVPWSKGYRDYKLQLIENSIRDSELLKAFQAGNIPQGFGKGVDERCVEYPWVISRLPGNAGRILDAGSALNFEEIVTLPILVQSDLTIAGLAVEKRCYYENGISYQFCDLRDLPFRDNWFDVVACVSTLEHIGMDNSIYGHDDEVGEEEDASPDLSGVEEAVSELVRIVKPEGKILVTVPVGRFEHHGFFQQFNEEMLSTLKSGLSQHGDVVEQYFRYTAEGWFGSSWEDCSESQSHNPHTGKGKGDDGAAHCRAVGCFEVEAKT